MPARRLRRVVPAPRIHVTSYGPDGVEERDVARLEDARPLRGRRAVTWVNVDAPDEDVYRSLEADFGVHPLTVEDVRHTRQRPKVEEYAGFVYVVTQMVSVSPRGRVETEQLSLLLGPDWLITIQEEPGDDFDPVRERIRQGRHPLRTAGSDYLMYALLDLVVDAYFPVLERIGRDLDVLDEAAERPGAADVRRRLHVARHALRALSRVAWPQRDALVSLERDEVPFVAPGTLPFLRDVNDHAARVIDLVETAREHAADVLSLHAATVAQRTNEVVKVLTIVTTIFIPLSFVAGVYGMNFDANAGPWSMPELRHPLGYPLALLAMAAIAATMLVAFRRRGWM